MLDPVPRYNNPPSVLQSNVEICRCQCSNAGSIQLLYNGNQGSCSVAGNGRKRRHGYMPVAQGIETEWFNIQDSFWQRIRLIIACFCFVSVNKINQKHLQAICTFFDRLILTDVFDIDFAMDSIESIDQHLFELEHKWKRQGLINQTDSLIPNRVVCWKVE